MEREEVQPVQFGTFTGVFTPTLLTILGVIMYLRIGWVVGNAGLMGALLIMGLAMLITVCTGLSLSSIATNTRIGAGGPYAIITRSLGLEVGGSIGIPLYLSRPLGVAMYIFGFREGWQWLFPSHPALLVDLVVFGLLFAIAYRSADLAFRVQYVIMAVIAASLLSIFAGEPSYKPAATVTWWGSYPGFPERGFGGTTMWTVFAVFFPATTGILAGANMSGDLRDPRRAIPRGTMSAIVLSSVIYAAIAWWCSRAGTMEELSTNYNVVMDRAAVPWVVLAGLLGATFSSALAGLVGGPRILMAMGQHGLLPRSEWLARTDTDGEPRNAMLLTGILTFACMMMRDLNAIAPLVTMFFLITYCVINIVVLFEQGLGLVSYRPTLKVPIAVPLAGAAGSIFSMFIVNPTFGLIAVGMVVAIYVSIDRLAEIEDEGATSDQVRSSLFVALAEWAAHRVSDRAHDNVRAWKPNILVPFEDVADVRGSFDLLSDAAAPEGSVKLLGLATDQAVEELRPRIERLERAFVERGLYATSSMVDCTDYRTGAMAGLQALQSAFFRPNLLYLTLGQDPTRFEEVRDLIYLARRTGVGTFLVARHPQAGLGQRREVNIWIAAPAGGWDAASLFEGRNLNLALLIGVRLIRSWKCRVRLVTVIQSQEDLPHAQAMLRELCDLARLPDAGTHREVMVGSFEDAVVRMASADLNIMGLQPDPDFAFVHRMVERGRASCLFVVDSGRESALA